MKDKKLSYNELISRIEDIEYFVSAIERLFNMYKEKRIEVYTLVHNIAKNYIRVINEVAPSITSWVLKNSITISEEVRKLAEQDELPDDLREIGIQIYVLLERIEHLYMNDLYEEVNVKEYGMTIQLIVDKKPCSAKVEQIVVLLEHPRPVLTCSAEGHIFHVKIDNIRVLTHLAYNHFSEIINILAGIYRRTYGKITGLRRELEEIKEKASELFLHLKLSV